jgi:NAD(P)-dependent dehydrogenase (short-subunit alcohol dehydrogenase family)
MRGKTVVITGGTSGIGEVAAEILAKKGARIVLLLVARDKTRGDSTLARLRNSSPGVAHSIYFADLARLAEMKRVAAQIADQEQRIDVLINNAGALFARRRLTQDGLEFTFALNHMAYFVLTEGLRERLLASRPARIINTASAAHQDATLNFDDLQSAKNYRAMKAYSRSKLCNILFTRELARRLHGTGVTANCLHPGCPSAPEVWSDNGGSDGERVLASVCLVGRVVKPRNRSIFAALQQPPRPGSSFAACRRRTRNVSGSGLDVHRRAAWFVQHGA